MTEKECYNCKHLDVFFRDEPCKSCLGESDKPNWEPIE